MKSNKEILNQFGELVIEYVYDDAIKHLNDLINDSTKWGVGKEYTEVFDKLSKEDVNKLKAYVKKTIGTSLFSFLSILEENEEFKLIYEENKNQVNLVEISEMLKAEPTIENGWIERFSKHATEDK
ncbi:hypothetical protein [Tenacibaculum amylolyticum]|uniref:hypothetical protein n=1 Tax=Tenacibaculum amylolyticum TaxID=104269 RepID=UPI003894D287